MPNTTIAASAGHDHLLADRVQRAIERGQRARVGLGDGADQHGIGERRAEGDDDREDVQGEDDFVERDGYEHGREPIGPSGASSYAEYFDVIPRLRRVFRHNDLYATAYDDIFT